MKTNLHFLIFFFGFFILIWTVHSQINVWPKPREISWPTPRSSHLSASFRILAPRHHPHLSHAVGRYLRLIITERHRPLLPISANLTTSPPLMTLTVSVANLSAPLQHGVDESYSLSVPASGAAADLSAETPWGAMRGLETLSQLVWCDGEGRRRVARGVEVRDAPLMQHRGLLVDTARSYYGVAELERTIGAMAMNKMNVFHWHLTDSQSFPLVLESEPELAEKGSYGEEMRYTAEDVRRVVEVGMQHGVRVVPEIDTPGHTASWAEAHPDIVTCANMFWWPTGTEWPDRLASEPGSGQLNPLNPKTYQVVKNVIRDVASLFPDSFYHSGADEVVPGCWKADPTVQKFLSNGGTLNQLLEMFINTTHPYITSFNRTAVYWEDVLLDPTIRVGPASLPTETTILQTWNNGPDNTKRIVKAGYRAIVSSSDFYYLDCGHGGFVGNDSQYDRQTGGGKGGSWCAPFKTWQRVYDYDITYGLDEHEAKLVLGGEVALWSEQADPTVLDGRVWPRASAMAEALWSGNRDEKGRKRYAEATDRLNEWRHRMVGRGIGAEPIQPLWCINHPGMCNLVQ